MQMQVCPNCGEENPAKFRLCGYCGTALAQALPPQELRKTVTIIFSDLKGSTSLGEMIDPEALHEIKNRYFAAMADVLEHHGGKIEKYIGDAIMAVFGLPKVREDDALRAVRAALGMQERLHEINQEFELGYGISLAARMGVNTGEVVATADPNADQRLADGDAVNVAARLEQASPAMEVLIGDLTYQLVRDHVEVEAVEPLTLKGKAEPVPAYRLVSMRSEAAPQAAHRSPLVGRDAEVAELRTVFDEAIHDRKVRLVTVIGDAGVGKSRLIADFVAAAAERATVLRGRCLPYGDGITFWPIVEVVRQAAGIADDDAPEAAAQKISGLIGPDVADPDRVVQRVCSAVGLSTMSFPVSELFWAIRTLFEQLARDRPLVVVVDDLHSAETTFLELLEHVVESAAAGILLLGSARHELLDHRTDWGVLPGTRRIVLTPLSDADTEQMIDQILGRAGLEPEIRGRVARAAEGNPLFVEQMVSMLVDRGVIQSNGDQWVAAGDVTELTIPPTISALLSARLDHLSREERAVIEPAAVIGFVFPEPAVEELVPDPLRMAVPAQLGALDRKQFVHPAKDVEVDFYRFHHLLIRDAAYNSLLKRARAQLHEQFVAWAEPVNKARDREVEFEEILGYHLEQAYRYRSELGPIDEETATIGRRAAEKLSSAGRRAFARADAPAAANLLQRATGLLTADDPRRLELLSELGEALIEQGAFDRAEAAVSEAIERSIAIADRRLEGRGLLVRYQLRFSVSGSVGETAVADAEIRAAMAEFERTDDVAGQARAWRLLSVIEGTAGRYDGAAAAAERVVGLASRVDDSRLAARGAQSLAYHTLVGRTPVDEALARSQDVIGHVRTDRQAEAIILGVLAQLHAMAGRFDEARELYRRGRRNVADLGPSVSAASTSLEASRVEMLAGDPQTAERELRADYVVLEAMGESYFRSTISALLAHALWAQGRPDEAATYADIARELTDEDDVLSQVSWRTAKAKVLAAAGDGDTAVKLATEAVSIASGTEGIELQADALLDLSEVLRILGRTNEQGPHLREALALYQQKGDVVLAALARERLAAVPTERAAV